MAEAPHKYLPLFISEAGEQLEQLQSELVKLEQEPPGGPLWASIFRRVHSVKGSAATVGLPPIVDIAHAAETLIGKLKASGQKPERGQIDLLLQACDALAAEVRHAAVSVERSKREQLTAGSSLVARLADASRAVPETPPPPAAVRVTEKLAVDPSLPKLDVFFSLTKGCQAPGARALIVQRKLRALGTLMEMEPAPQSLMQKKGGVRVAALLATSR